MADLLRNHAPEIAAMDLFVVPTIGFKLLYGFVVVRIHPQRSRVQQRHSQPDSRMGCAPDHRSIPVE